MAHKDITCIAQSEGYELCDNCFAGKTYADLEKFKHEDTIFRTSSGAVEWRPKLIDSDWYRPEGFSSQKISSTRRRQRSQLISPVSSSRSKIPRSSGGRYRDAAGLIHEPELKPGQEIKNPKSLFERRRPRQKVHVWIDTPVSRLHGNDSAHALLNIPLAPDEALRANFLKARLDASQKHRREDRYRDPLR